MVLVQPACWRIDFRRLAVLLVAVLLVPLGGALRAVDAPLAAHPALLSLAAQQPRSTVDVIVQKTAPDTGVEALVEQLGGRITRDLHIINAFSATIPAASVRQIAAAAGVRWVSPDAPVQDNGGPDGTVNTTKLLNSYNKAVRADAAWAQGYQGSSVTVAVVDSGVAPKDDLKNSSNVPRISASVKTNSATPNISDGYGHGTGVAGVIAGNGDLSSGKYIGIAPKVNLVNVKVSDDQGMATASDVVNGLQWINDNRSTYNIRVVNMSLNATVEQSYHVDPMAAAAEILWFNGVVVVVSAGNNGNSSGGIIYPPASDPFVITVGAADDRGTPGIADDVIASYSAYGTTRDGFAKPDLVAPGSNIITLSGTNNSVLFKSYPNHKVDKMGHYFRMSGTSMSAPVVSGAIALLLQDEPNLTPDQVKHRLKATANKNWAGYNVTKAGAGYLDIYAAITGTTTLNANTGLVMSALLSPTGSTSSTWNSASWGTANWGSANWGSANWGSANWGSDYWD